jgi:hypothetical protein
VFRLSDVSEERSSDMFISSGESYIKVDGTWSSRSLRNVETKNTVPCNCQMQKSCCAHKKYQKMTTQGNILEHKSSNTISSVSNMKPSAGTAAVEG